MERARITLITVRATITGISHHAIISGAISIQINPPLKIVAITAILTGIARTTIEIVTVALKVTMGLDPALTNQVCAVLMINVTMNTSNRVTRIALRGPTLVRVTAKTLRVQAHAHHIATGNHTEAINEMNSIAILDRHVIPTVTGDHLATLKATSTVGSLAVMIVINGHFATGHNVIRKTLASRADQQGKLIFRAGLKNSHGVGQNASYSRVITSILMHSTLLSLPQLKLRATQMLPRRRKKVILHLP